MSTILFISIIFPIYILVICVNKLKSVITINYMYTINMSEY